MAETYLVGIDAGTTGCKTVVFDLDGNALGSDYREYPSRFPKEGWVEQTYDDIIPPLVDSCRVAIKKSGVKRERIAAVAFSSQAPLLTMLDEEGFLMRDFVSWQDLRGAPYIKELREAYGSEKYYQETGDPLNTNSAAPKWAWLRDNEPENFERARWLLSEQEYLLKIWGAEDYWTDLSSASREGMLDVNEAEWSKPIHDLVGIPLEKRAKLSKVPGQVVGTVTGDIALRAGLPDGVALCVGGHDQNCCTFGAGAIKGGDTAMVMGTFGSCYVVMDKPMRDPKRKLIVKPNHGMPNWTIEAFSNTSASAFRWYRDTFCQLETASGQVVGIDPYDMLTREASRSPIGASGVTFLPYLAGAAGARQNSDARANLFGMSLSTNKNDIARAVLEGICFEMRDILNAQEAAGVEVGTIRLVGGAANSEFWSQMLADSLGHPIEILSSNQAGCLGAAMYAGVGVGAYEDCEDAAERAVKVSARYEPNPDVAAEYDKAFEKFVECYDSLDGNLF